MIPEFGPVYDEEAIFSPEDAVSGEGRPDLPAAMILGFQDVLLDSVEAVGEPIDHPPGPFEYHALSESVGFVPVQKMGVGAPVAAIATEKAIAGGAETVLMLGGTAALQSEFSPESALLPTRAVRDEGASYHYLPPDEPARPTPDLVDRLETTFEARGIDTHNGPTWTTSAMFRETIPQLDHYRREGFVSLCMETAAVWAVCAYRGVDTATVHAIDGYAVPGEQRSADGLDDRLATLLGPTVEALEGHVGSR